MLSELAIDAVASTMNMTLSGGGAAPAASAAALVVISIVGNPKIVAKNKGTVAFCCT